MVAFIALMVVILLSAALGTCLVLTWGGHLLGRDDVRLRSMRAAADINRLVIEARSKLVDAALDANRRRR